MHSGVAGSYCSQNARSIDQRHGRSRGDDYELIRWVLICSGKVESASVSTRSLDFVHILAPRRDLPEFPVGLVRNHVQSAVRTLAHVADALTTIRQKVLFADNAVAVYDQPHESL